MMRLATIAGLVLIAGLGCSGGGPDRHAVSGTVTFKGTPVREGRILFITPGQAPDEDDIKDGKFSMLVQPGKKRVEIRAWHQVGENDMGPIKELYIPARYHAESELEVDIDGPRQDLEFKLTGD